MIDVVNPEQKADVEYIEEALHLLKDNPNFDKLRSKIKVLSPAQQKAAIQYTLKLQQKKQQLQPQQVAIPLVSERDIVHSELLDAVCAGDVAKLHSLLVRFKKPANVQVNAKGDPLPHPLLHWAALEGQLEVVHYLIGQIQLQTDKILSEKAANPIDEPNARGETALHWGCIKGKVRCIHALIASGASLTLGDEKGYTALHHAAQYGHVVVLAQLIRKQHTLSLFDRLVEIRDGCGRTALHWAAYKRHLTSAEFLLGKGSDPWAKDSEGCTPLHWTGLQAEIDVLQALVLAVQNQHKTEATAHKAVVKYLEEKDNTGHNAFQLADAKSEKFHKSSAEAENYDHAVRLLKWTHDAASKGKKLSKGFGGTRTPANKRYAEDYKMWVWWVWLAIITPGMVKYFFFVLPVMFPIVPITSFVIFGSLAFTWVTWLRLQAKDPGYLVCDPVKNISKHKTIYNYILPCYPVPRGKQKISDNVINDQRVELLETGVDGFDDAVTVCNENVPLSRYYRELYLEVLDKGLLVPVCTSCEVVKPLRSKHDRFADKCVLKFDHWCPWVGASVAQYNYRDFMGFCTGVTVLMAAWIYTVFEYTKFLNPGTTLFMAFTRFDTAVWHVALFYPVILCWFYGVVMIAQHAYLVSKNLTTNEQVNIYKYKYLQRDHKGNVTNPFSRGMMKNWAEFFGLMEPVKVNFRKYHQFLFEGGDKVQEKIQKVKQVYAFKDADNNKKKSLVSITTTDEISANDINLSLLPTK